MAPRGGKTAVGKRKSEAAATEVEEPKPKSKKASSKAQHTVNQEKANDIKDLEERRKQTQEQLKAVERQIYNLETQYFDTANPQGNALKGYEGLLSSSSASMKRAQFKHEDRIFSSSSFTGSLHSKATDA